MLLIVMHESGTWRVRPGQILTFGRGAGCTITLPAADRGVSRSAGSLVFEQGTWWLRNDSSSSVLYVSGDRGFRVDLPPGMQAPVQQWHAKIRLQGLLDCYTLRLRLPDLDAVPEPGPEAGQGGGVAASATGEHLVTSTRRRPPLSGSDRLILAARFEDYLDWRHTGPAAPRSAKETAERIGWQAHTVAKRCENIRDRYSRLGVPGLRGPRPGGTGDAADLDRRAHRQRPAAPSQPGTRRAARGLILLPGGGIGSPDREMSCFRGGFPAATVAPRGRRPGNIAPNPGDDEPIPANFR